MYEVLRRDADKRPADELVPASASNTQKALAVDVTITDPTSKRSLDKDCDMVDPKAATKRTRRR